MKTIMLVLGAERREETSLGPVDFRPSFEKLIGGAYDDIVARLLDGKRTRRVHPHAHGGLRGSATHTLAQSSEDIVKREYPRAEWHYMKVDAYPVHVFVATERGIPVAIAAPSTSRPDDFDKVKRWEATLPS
jgi:hypothetical protein